MALERFEGTVARVVYTAPDGAFAVVRLEVEGRPQPITVVGALGGIAVGEQVEVAGTFEQHGNYGQQLRAQRAIPVVPTTNAGVERYLATLPGIGPESARRLVEAFGERAIDVLATEPWRAAKIKGIGKKRAVNAAEQAKARRSERDVMVFLQGHGISAGYAQRILKRWGDHAIARLRENPYRLAREVPGFGFVLADRIARQLGIGPTSPQRVEAALYHTLQSLSDDGHCYATAPALVEKAGEVVEVSGEIFHEALLSLVGQGAVAYEDGERVWLPALHLAEVELARRLRLLLAAAKPIGGPRAGGRAAGELERLSDGQRRAVAMVATAGVAVITGGPGTGKTTVMKATVACWEEARRKVILAAPTGRAAKRLSEATGRPASTVHRLLDWGGDKEFGKNAQNPLEADLIVVDEASMLDVQLARALCLAVPPGATLLLVGDVDQLPSVGPGQVLADVIQSGVVPVARLREIFRQEKGSRIIEVAHGILEGIAPTPRERSDGANEDKRPPGTPPTEDFYVIPVEDPIAARERVIKLVRERIPLAFGLHPTRDVQVLTPMHRGEAGTEALNRALQAALNPDGAVLLRGQRSALRVGDKVIQVKNDYDREVWNGDIGEVQRIDAEEGGAVVVFDERPVVYEREALDQLELAYAVSVHKSQGSEYPAVVLALLPEHYMLLRRNLLYTAITRGKRLVVIVGSPRALRRAVATVDAESRNTRLRERLRALHAPREGEPAASAE